MLPDINLSEMLHDGEVIWRGAQVLFALIGKIRHKQSREVALVVQLSRTPLKDVQRFLESRRIEAEMIVVTRPGDPPELFIPVEPALWEEIVRDFHAGVVRVQQQRGAQRFHVFLAAPAALAFAMGCTMSTQYDAHLYHWDGSTYVEVIRDTSRHRLMGDR
jgi:SMODS-associated and fused to various effectors sensor domain